ncbi:hypothetical protein [Nocardioides bizhenqiangii]|uniref:DUF4178 domain-containing protein n=1 Tax=Nocardioides bizhenqiangii TaxID=3095076 RepID=A0ABZ0ZRB2_9ACTN|nr:hypothetical protein [Nocardioides sp. HM61]WQQ26846.1 hypothetical protein SHK19_01110 [Nocardioides sp. HM61]
MELHKDIRDLIRSNGPAILEDPMGFRAGLEDLLGDESLPTGLINLLVDAVRNQAVWLVVHNVDNGADPVSAVRDAGQRFALARGGGDPAMCGWACAVLGYGVGRIDEATVAAFSSRHLPAPPPPPPPPPSSLPPLPRADVHSRTTAFAPQFPPAPPPPAPAARKRWPFVVAVVLVLLLATGGGVAWWQLSSDDDTASASQSEEENGGEDGTEDDGSTDDGSTDDGSGEGDGGIDLEDVDTRYRYLAENITVGATSCVDVDPPAGAEEMLECTVPVGTLRLTTYASTDDLSVGRVRVVDATRPYTLSGQDQGQLFYAFDPKLFTPHEPGTAEIYWDSKFARVAAHLTASAGSEYADVETQYGLTSPTVEAPTEPGLPRLIEFIRTWPKIKGCERQFTFIEGELEANWCSYRSRRWGELNVYVSTFRTGRDFLAYRSDTAEWEDEDAVYEGGNWNFTETPDVNEGRQHGYLIQDGTADENAVFYIDDAKCRCYLEAYGPDGEASATPEALAALFFS